MIADKRELDKNEKADIEKNLVDNKDTILSIIDKMQKHEVTPSICN